jgi:hypothetical protein
LEIEAVSDLERGTATVILEREPELGDALLHVYRQRPAKLGDKALCGHVKVNPSNIESWGDGPDRCVVCTALYWGQFK